MEVAIIEVSDPNNKVGTTHFLEDKKKTAKILKHMYKAIMSLNKRPSFEFKKPVKVYGFHVYLNTLYTYSVQQPTLHGPYLFQQEFSVQLCHNKVVIPSLPDFVSNLWLIRLGLSEDLSSVADISAHLPQDVLHGQHKHMENSLYGEPTPTSSIGSSDAEKSY
ncbi:hypothetical protein MBANPS3_006877 [Mucor bainieri]